MYIILSKDDNVHTGFSALGHEIHLARFILCDMLHTNFINKDDTIVTYSSDRFFLYNNFFINVISYNEYLLLNNLHKQDTLLLEILIIY